MSLRRFFRIPPAVDGAFRTNFVHFLWDIGWWGLYTGTTAAFLSIYAARCGATPQQIGLLSALPALVSLLISLPAGRFLRRFPAGPATAVSAFVSRAMLVAYAVLPWLLTSEEQVNAILLMTILIAVPATFINISFSQMFIEAVPADWRGDMVGARNALSSIISFAITLISGQILTWLPFPAGYQVVFFIGFIGATMTAYHIAHIRPVAPSPLPPAPQGARRAALLPLLDDKARTYLRVIGLLFVFNLTNSMLGPLVPTLLVKTLGLSDATISVGTGVANMLVFTVSLFMARFTRRLGNRRATALGAMLLTLHAAALAMATDATFYLLAAVAGGLASGVLGTAQYNYHLENVPADGRSVWLSWNLLLGNTAVLLGALAGPAVAQLTGTATALTLLGALRFLFGLLILRWG